jgi:hypothetical protein
MPDIPISDIHYLYFIIPGFITVWSYRYFTYSKEKGNFVLLGLSFFWGIVIAALVAAPQANKETVAELMKNPYAAMLVFSAFGFIFAAAASLLKQKNRLRDVYHSVKNVVRDIRRNLKQRK